MFIVGCSSEEMQVHMRGEFQDANVSVRNFTTSLELELPVPHTFTPSEHVTLGLKFLKPRKCMQCSFTAAKLPNLSQISNISIKYTLYT